MFFERSRMFLGGSRVFFERSRVFFGIEANASDDPARPSAKRVATESGETCCNGVRRDVLHRGQVKRVATESDGDSGGCKPAARFSHVM